MFDSFQCHDRMSDLEHESLCKIAELERAIQTIRQERDQAIQQARQHGEEVATLRRESKQLKENERKMRGNRNLLLFYHINIFRMNSSNKGALH